MNALVEELRKLADAQRQAAAAQAGVILLMTRLGIDEFTFHPDELQEVSRGLIIELNAETHQVRFVTGDRAQAEAEAEGLIKEDVHLER